MSRCINSAPPYQDRTYQLWLLSSGSQADVVAWLQWHDPQGSYTDSASDLAGMSRLSLRAARNIMRSMLGAMQPKAVAS